MYLHLLLLAFEVSAIHEDHSRSSSLEEVMRREPRELSMDFDPTHPDQDLQKSLLSKLEIIDFNRKSSIFKLEKEENG